MRLIDLGGAKATRTDCIARMAFGGTCPDFSPDGSRVVFVAPPRREAAPEIFEVTLADERVRQVTRDGAAKMFPRHAADGRLCWQQFVAREGEDATAQVVVQDGASSRLLTNDPVSAVTPSWSPDGREVIYASLDDGALRAVAVADGTTRQLVPPGHLRLFPQMSADGSLVMYLESAVPPSAFEPPSEHWLAADGRKSKPRLGQDFRLRVARIADGATWEIPLERGFDAESGSVLAKTNLYWFQWRREAPGGSGGAPDRAEGGSAHGHEMQDEG
jgi:hypothetical protein